MPSLHRHGTDRKGVGIFQQAFCNAKRADVYTSALLAGAMKPLNVLSKFENHFAIRTVRFQVQLEADGYFLLRRFLCLHPQQAGWVGTNLQFSNPILQIQLQNTCWASPKPDIQHKIALATRFRWYRISKFSWRKICSMKIGVDSFNIASNRNYYSRFWRQKAEVMLPKNLSNFMVCSFQSRSHEPDLPSPVFSLKTGPDTS